MARRSGHVSRFVLVLMLAAVILVALGLLPNPREPSSAPYAVLPFPDGKLAALSIEDDADGGDLEHLVPVYDLLNRLHLRVTKAVWMFPAEGESGDRRYTMESPALRAFAVALARAGHEIALHGVTSANDTRETIARGFAEFRTVFGHDPTMHIDHSKNLENLYFGQYRFDSGAARALYSVFDGTDYQGHQQQSPYFWGDLARERVKYHRGWYVASLNTLAVNPSMPAHDPDKPYVRYWHSVTDAVTGDRFVSQVTPATLESLKAEHGAAIVYTHFAFGFLDASRRHVREDGARILERVAGDQSLWVAPASELLDRLLLFQQITAELKDGALLLTNRNAEPVTGVTVLTGPVAAASLACATGCSLRPADTGTLIVDRLPPYSVTILTGGAPGRLVPAAATGPMEQVRCVAQWIWRSIAIRI